MRTYLLAALSVLALTASAQKKNKTAEQFSKTITANDLKTHLYILAGPEMEGRETGMEGQRKAAEYLKQQFIIGEYYQKIVLVQVFTVLLICLKQDKLLVIVFLLLM